VSLYKTKPVIGRNKFNETRDQLIICNT